MILQNLHYSYLVCGIFYLDCINKSLQHTQYFSYFRKYAIPYHNSPLMKYAQCLLIIYLFPIYQCQSPSAVPLPSAKKALVIQKTYYSSGELKSEGFINEDSLREGTYQEYLPDGQLVRSIEYLDGRPHGRYVTFSNTGDTVSVHDYQAGLPVGRFRWYRPNGQLQQEGEKVEGHTEGIARAYYEDGTLQSLINYRRGQKYKDGQWYYPSGRLQRWAYFGSIGQECFRLNFTDQGTIHSSMGSPIADLNVEANDFKGRIQLTFVVASPPESQYTVSLRKELGKKFKILTLRQSEHSFSWTEAVNEPLPYSYAIHLSLRAAGEDSARLFKQRIKVLPGKKIEYAIL